MSTYSVLSALSARSIARIPRGPLAPTALVDGLRIFPSSQAGSVVPAITLLFLGELHAHARGIVRLRAAAKSETLLHVTAVALPTGVRGQPLSPSGVSFRFGALMDVAMLDLK